MKIFHEKLAKLINVILVWNRFFLNSYLWRYCLIKQNKIYSISSGFLLTKVCFTIMFINYIIWGFWGTVLKSWSNWRNTEKIAKLKHDSELKRLWIKIVKIIGFHIYLNSNFYLKDVYEFTQQIRPSVYTM
jgi:hypothetical protein